MSFLSNRKFHILALLALLTVFVGVTIAEAAVSLNASTTAFPYLVPMQRKMRIRPILTVGDSVNLKPDGTPYRMAGIPDGLGAFDNGDGTFTVLMNHELGANVGAVRAHGAKGAFVSKWIVRKSDLTVLHGEDLIQNVVTWNTATYSWNPPTQGVVFSRFCSADLPGEAAFFDFNTGMGYPGRIFMNGEETGSEGRAFAHLMDGTSYELPWLGKFSWENAVTHPRAGAKTIVVGLDDTTPGQVYVYVGAKTNSANPVEAAGLTNGSLFGIQVQGLDLETAATTVADNTPFTLFNFGDVSGMTGAQLDAQSTANGVSRFLRPEDGAWNPEGTNDFYFVTTASFTGPSRLWRLRFNDIANPEAGGTISMLLNGTEGQKMMDNLTINRRNQIFIQEDPGAQDYLAQIWRYDINTDMLLPVARHDPDLFTPGRPLFLTRDEESSGIIDMESILGRGWFLVDVQAHYNIGDAELVEGGQLLALYLPPNR